MRNYEDAPKMCEPTPQTISDKVDGISNALSDLHNIAESLENKLIGAMPKEDGSKPPKPYGGINETLNDIQNKIGYLFSVLINLNEKL